MQGCNRSELNYGLSFDIWLRIRLDDLILKKGKEIGREVKGQGDWTAESSPGYSHYFHGCTPGDKKTPCKVARPQPLAAAPQRKPPYLVRARSAQRM